MHAVYFTNWSIYGRGYTPSKLPFEFLTHVIYAFLKPDPVTGEICLSDPWADIEKPMELGGRGCIGELAILKHKYRHLRVLLSVGGWTYSQDLTRIFMDPHKRRRFVESTLTLTETYQFDGIDIDWEYPQSPQEGFIFTEVLQELRRGLNGIEQNHKCTLDLTIAAPAGSQHIANLPLIEMNKFLSWWNIMTYDFAGSWSSVAGHLANLYGSEVSCELVIAQYLQAGIPPEKLVLGLPLYGRSFRGAQFIGDTFDGVLPGTYEAGSHDVKELPLHGAQQKIDKKSGAAICVNKSGLVSYDTHETIMQKAEFVTSSHLRGAMWWEASGDCAGEDSLVGTFTRKFKVKSEGSNWI